MSKIVNMVKVFGIKMTDLDVIFDKTVKTTGQTQYHLELGGVQYQSPSVSVLMKQAVAAIQEWIDELPSVLQKDSQNDLDTLYNKVSNVTIELRYEGAFQTYLISEMNVFTILLTIASAKENGDWPD